MEKLLEFVMWLGIIIIAIILVPIIIILSARGINSVKHRIPTETGIQKEVYITLNDTEQFISIRGEDTENPIIVFLHGGPGFPMGHISHHFQIDLEDDYTIVHWDQRGSGRTYYKNKKTFSADELSTELLLDDLDELVDYLQEKFGQDQVIIMGHSWGTVLGTRYVLEYPEKVSSYIAIGYAMNLRDGSIYSANEALDLAKKANNTDDVNDLQKAIASFNSADSLENLNLDSFATLRSICTKYLMQKEEVSFIEHAWTGLTSPSTNMKDIKWFLTFSNFEKICALTAPLMDYAMFHYEADALGYNFDVPLYIIQGENDWTTPTAMVEEYFEKINTPKKEFIVIPNAGHNTFFDSPVEFCNAVKTALK